MAVLMVLVVVVVVAVLVVVVVEVVPAISSSSSSSGSREWPATTRGPMGWAHGRRPRDQAPSVAE